MSSLIPKQRTKFRHNPGSKLTKYILSLPIEGLCKSCEELIIWKKDHRKYKPLTTMRRCSLCFEVNIKEAYHIICRRCGREQNKCEKCLKKL